jgi:dTDP-4-amino-4,6-dideoxygalactose transaminase
MKQPQLDNRFPPVINGKISEIYPWSGFFGDHLTLFICYVKKFFKINSKEEPVDQTIKDFFNCQNIYLLDSGRSALVIALKALGLNPGEEVLLSAFNCTAVAESIIQAGGIIKFVDINSKAGLDINSIKNTISPKTKCIIVTHIYGLVDDLEELSSLCKSRGIFLINDLAQTLENPSSDKKLNTYGDVSIYSFGAEKHLFALGGGAIVTHRNNLVDKIGKNLPQEIVSDRSLFILLLERWKYYFTFFSLKYLKVIILPLKQAGLIFKFLPIKTIYLSDQLIKPKFMHPVQKSLLIKKLRLYKIYFDKTTDNFNYLKNELNVYLLHKDQQMPLYATICIDAESRFNLAEYLSKHGVQTVWNYLPLYKNESLNKIELGETEKLWQGVLSIPFRYPMTNKRVKQICEIINIYKNNEN